MYYADLTRRDAATLVPARDDLETAIQARGYFGVEAVETGEASVRLLIRCGTESRALELARDVQREVLHDTEWNLWDLDIAPVEGTR
jgi:hypothetical protein